MLITSLLKKLQIRWLYLHQNYLEAYSQHTNIRIIENPHAGIGGAWELMGQLQFNFLINKGLQPHHKMLDIGCGTLRGGRHFIGYLNSNNYTGMDISSEAIEYGKKLIKVENLINKQPRLMLNQSKNLQFQEFNYEKFDYLFAQSVFTHLQPHHIEECFQNLSKIMDNESLFFFTFFESESFQRNSVKDFSYPWSFFTNLAVKYGFLIERENTYYHPVGQQMVKLQLNNQCVS